MKDCTPSRDLGTEFLRTEKLGSTRPPERILVIRSGGLGDFVVTLPVLAALRGKWPEAKLEILGKPSIAELAVGRFYAVAASSLDDRVFARLFAENAPLGDQLHAYLSRFDIAVNFLPDKDGTMAKQLAKAIESAWTIPPPGPGLAASRQFLASLPISVEVNERSHQPVMHLTASDRARAAKLLGSCGLNPGGCIGIHPGSGSRRKNWSADQFAEVANRLNQSGHRIFILEGEADREQVQALTDLMKGKPMVIRDLRVVEAASLLSQCALLIGNDSGISHVAAAVGAPVICLFGPTDPVVWKPQGERVEVLQFEEATPELVVRKALQMIGQ